MKNKLCFQTLPHAASYIVHLEGEELLFVLPAISSLNFTNIFSLIKFPILTLFIVVVRQ